MSRIVFEQFQFDIDTQELWCGTELVALQPKQALVLALLLQSAGQLVSRETLKTQVWGHTVVEFDQSINFCIKAIRQALNDSPKTPRFIQTVPKKGYRFIGNIAAVPLAQTAFSSAGEDKNHKSKPSLFRLFIASTTGLVFALSAALWWSTDVSTTPSNVPDFSRYDVQLTSDYRRAVYLFEKGNSNDYRQSYHLLQKVVAIAPDFTHAQAYLSLSALFGQLDNYHQRAREHAELARLQEPDSALTALAQGAVAFYLDWQIKQAQQWFERATQRDPSLVMAWHELAVTAVLLQQHSVAENSIAKALVLAPGEVQELYHAGWFYSVIGQPQQALKQCEQSLEINPHHLFSLNCAAESAYTLGLISKSLQYIEKIMALYQVESNISDPLLSAVKQGDFSTYYQWQLTRWQQDKLPSFLLALAAANANETQLVIEYAQQTIRSKAIYTPLLLAFSEFQPYIQRGDFDFVKQVVLLNQ